MIELLVVIGIIAVLIALILPVLSGAKEQSRKVICQSNLRQIAIGALMYSNNNRGILPCCAPLSQNGFSHDWIYWQKSRDIRDSAIAKYVNVTNNTFICPSDYLPTHLHPQTISSFGPYNFSYTMNQLLGSYVQNGYPIKVSTVRRPSQIILFVEQEDTGIDDGMWCPSLGNTDYISTVHDKTARPEKQFNTGNYMANPKAKGNVAFIDCHVEYISKLEAHNPIRYNPRR